MNSSGLVVFRRDAGNYYIFAQYPMASALPADSTLITDYKVDLYDPVGAALIASNVQLTYVAAMRGFLSASRVKSELDTKEFLAIIHKPTSANTTIQTFTRFIYVADLLKRQDEIEADVDAFQTDFNTFETTNQGEHDATQSAVAIVDSQADTYEANAVSRQTTNITEHDVTQAAIAAIPATDLAPIILRLDDTTYGLAALNSDLDLIIARLGVTVDTGGTSTAGTAMAKLNAILGNLGGGGAITVALAP